MSQKEIDELDAIQRWAWQEDLELRERAKHDPELAALIAEADRRYEQRYGHPWVNPLVAADG